MVEYPIVDRLRCNYNGRDFSGPAPEGMVLPTRVMLEAADEIGRLIAEVERLQEEHGKACHLVAKMHFAATGSTEGPRRGVVEDIDDLRIEAERLQSEFNKAAQIIISAAESSDIQQKSGVELINENARLRRSLTISRAEGKREGVEEAAKIAEAHAQQVRVANTYRGKVNQMADEAAGWMDRIAAAVREAAQPKEG